MYGSIFLTDEKGITVEIPSHLQSYLQNISNSRTFEILQDAQLVKNFLEKQNNGFFSIEEYSLNEKIALLHDLTILGYYPYDTRTYNIWYIFNNIINHLINSREKRVINKQNIVNYIEKILLQEENGSEAQKNIQKLLNNTFAPATVIGERGLIFIGNEDESGFFELIIEDATAKILYKGLLLLRMPISGKESFRIENSILYCRNSEICGIVDLMKLLYIARYFTGGFDIPNKKLDSDILDIPSTYTNDIQNLFQSTLKSI